MKILTNKKINEIDLYTSRIHDRLCNSDLLIHEKAVLLGNIDLIRKICKLSYLRRHNVFPIMPEVKPPKKEECKHVYEIAFNSEIGAFLFCKHCAEIKELFNNKKTEQTQNYVHISIDELNDICDGAASVKEAKELLIERMQEGEC